MAVGARVELTIEESKSSVLPLHHPTIFCGSPYKNHKKKQKKTKIKIYKSIGGGEPLLTYILIIYHYLNMSSYF